MDNVFVIAYIVVNNARINIDAHVDDIAIDSNDKLHELLWHNLPSTLVYNESELSHKQPCT